MVQIDQDSLSGTYRKLFDTIEGRVDSCSTDLFQTVVEERREQLCQGLDSFKKPATQDRSKLSSSSVTVSGKTLKLNQQDRDLICRVSDITGINELQCSLLWDTYKHEHPELGDQLKDELLCENVELMLNFITFYMEERLLLLECIASLERISLDSQHPYAAIAVDFMGKLKKDSREGRSFAERLFAQYAQLTRSSVYSQTHAFTAWPLFWAKQNLKEQKGLLEILLLFSLTKPFKPEFVLNIIQELESDSFGTLQTSGYLLDKEGIVIRESVTSLCILLSVNIVVPPGLTIESTLDPSSLNDNLLDTPNMICRINQLALFMGTKNEHSVFLLAWSYFLTCVDTALTAGANIKGYEEVQLLLDGKQNLSSNILIDRPVTRGTDFEVLQPQEPSITQTANMDRTFAGRALKLNVFGVVSDILEDEVCSEEDTNSYGYRSIMMHLLQGFLSITRPLFLPLESYTQLMEATSLLYKNQGTLCHIFWTEHFNPNEHTSLISTARGRFPVFFNDLTKLLTSLSGSVDEDAAYKGESAIKVFEYLSCLPTITVILKDSVEISAVEENNRAIIYNQYFINVTYETNHVLGIRIPEATSGALLSSSQEERVIQFSYEYSGWHLMTSVLCAFMQEYPNPLINVKDDDDNLKGGNLTTITLILELIHKLLLHNPALAKPLVEHVEVNAAASIKNTPCPVLISTLCNILTSCSRIPSPPIEIQTLALKSITQLLPSYRDEVWGYLQTAPLLPHSNASKSVSVKFRAPSVYTPNSATQIQHIVAKTECTTGRYTLLIAFLDMVHELVKDIQIDQLESNENRLTGIRHQAQIETLYVCLHYIMLDVFPSYSGWRYKKISERFLIGIKVLNIFIDILQHFGELGVNSPTLSMGSIRNGILTNFLYDGGLYHVSPLLDTISEGANMATGLYKINHPKEAERCEKLTELSFMFTTLLLQHRLVEITRGTTRDHSTFERLMLESAVGSANPDFLLRIAKHINYRHNTALAIQATNVFILLCKTTATWKTVPNFVQFLGNSDQAQIIIRSYIRTALDHTQDDKLLTSIWQLLTILMETQPSLAILFLDCGDKVMPSPKSDTRRSAQNNTSSFSIPATRAALDILGHWETLSVMKPTVVSTVLLFLTTFWKTAFDHYALVESVRSDGALWTSLEKILFNISNEPDTESSQSVETNEKTQHEENIRQRCLNLSKSYAMRIIAYEIHLTAGKQKISSSSGNDYPTGLKNLMQKISDPAKLSAMRKSYLKDNFLFKSFKIFIEASSAHASDLIWATKTNTSGSAVLYEFLKGLIEQANAVENAALSSYSILIHFIRTLIEDWIDKHKTILTGNDMTAKKIYSAQAFDILTSLCGLLDRENFALMNSICDRTSIRYHAPLLESIMLCLRTLSGTIESVVSTNNGAVRLQTCLSSLTSAVCSSFHVLVIKAGSYSAPGSKIEESIADSCIRDVTIVVSLLEELIDTKYLIPVDVWLNIFIRHNTIGSLLDLFYGGTEILVNEVERQLSSSKEIYSFSITPYARTALYFLITLSNIPKAAKRLVSSNLFDSLCNNSLTSRLQQGVVDLFIRFGRGSINEPAFVERNPLHDVWCQMLCVVSNVMRSIGASELILHQTVNFMQIYGTQIGKAFSNANGANDSIFGLTPSESLSSPLLEEIKFINMIFFSLSRSLDRLSDIATNLFISYKDCSLLLLQRYLYFFTHPSHMQAQLYPVNNVERHLAEQFSSTESDKEGETVVKGSSQLMKSILKTTMVISHYTLSSLLILTKVNTILLKDDSDWPYGNTIIYPDMRVTMGESASFGTLVEYINAGMTMLTTSVDNKEEYPVQEILDVIQDCALLLVSQSALWICKPDMKKESRLEIAMDNIMDIVEILNKSMSTFNKLDENTPTLDLKAHSQLINTLRMFLSVHFFTN
ncbi:nucleoporin subcomplex protein binding to Pom34-domain-containing protein [Pilobolus umbonatus]|nr:nucleoporin subcomplex protein binding to Pom34-domain-containing protein [Pilobolus umbonatus]